MDFYLTSVSTYPTGSDFGIIHPSHHDEIQYMSNITQIQHRNSYLNVVWDHSKQEKLMITTKYIHNQSWVRSATHRWWVVVMVTGDGDSHTATVAGWWLLWTQQPRVIINMPTSMAIQMSSPSTQLQYSFDWGVWEIMLQTVSCQSK